MWVSLYSLHLCACYTTWHLAVHNCCREKVLKLCARQFSAAFPLYFFFLFTCSQPYCLGHVFLLSFFFALSLSFLPQEVINDCACFVGFIWHCSKVLYATKTAFWQSQKYPPPASLRKVPPWSDMLDRLLKCQSIKSLQKVAEALHCCTKITFLLTKHTVRSRLALIPRAIYIYF